MRSIKFILVIGVLALLPLLAGGGIAQTSDPEGVTSPSGTVLAAISYQGVLTDPGGSPLSGVYDLQFTFWSADAGGFQIGPTIYRWGEIITDGLYSTNLELDPDLIHGQELWLRILVREAGGTWETLSPRIQVLPTMYAMTVRPGAQIQGEPLVTDGAVLKTTLDGYFHTGKAMWGNTTSTGTAVYGESARGFGVYGYSPVSYGVWGHSEESYGGHFTSQAGNGIVVDTNGGTINDHAGVFSANWGWGIFATSTHNQAIRGEAGDLSVGKSMPGGAWGAVGIGQSGGTYGSSWSNWGVYGDSHNYRGVQGNTNRSDRNYGLHTYDNIYSLNYNLAGAIMNVAQNGGSETLEMGDVVVFSGISAPHEAVGAPVIQVAKADSANSTAVAGVVHQRLNIEALAENPPPGLEVTPDGTRQVGAEGLAEEDAPGFVEVTSEKPIRPGEYLLLVVQGPAQVKASALSGAIQPGDLLSSAGQDGRAARAAEMTIQGVSTTVPGAVFGKALEPLDDGQKLIYIFVTLQ
jgi:hypothetical protein